MTQTDVVYHRAIQMLENRYELGQCFRQNCQKTTHFPQSSSVRTQAYMEYPISQSENAAFRTSTETTEYIVTRESLANDTMSPWGLHLRFPLLDIIVARFCSCRNESRGIQDPDTWEIRVNSDRVIRGPKRETAWTLACDVATVLTWIASGAIQVTVDLVNDCLEASILSRVASDVMRDDIIETSNGSSPVSPRKRRRTHLRDPASETSTSTQTSALENGYAAIKNAMELPVLQRRYKASFSGVTNLVHDALCAIQQLVRGRTLNFSHTVLPYLFCATTPPALTFLLSPLSSPAASSDHPEVFKFLELLRRDIADVTPPCPKKYKSAEALASLLSQVWDTQHCGLTAAGLQKFREDGISTFLSDTAFSGAPSRLGRLVQSQVEICSKGCQYYESTASDGRHFCIDEMDHQRWERNNLLRQLFERRVCDARISQQESLWNEYQCRYKLLARFVKMTSCVALPFPPEALFFGRGSLAVPFGERGLKVGTDVIQQSNLCELQQKKHFGVNVTLKENLSMREVSCDGVDRASPTAQHVSLRPVTLSTFRPQSQFMPSQPAMVTGSPVVPSPCNMACPLSSCPYSFYSLWDMLSLSEVRATLRQILVYFESSQLQPEVLSCLSEMLPHILQTSKFACPSLELQCHGLKEDTSQAVRKNRVIVLHLIRVVEALRSQRSSRRLSPAMRQHLDILHSFLTTTTSSISSSESATAMPSDDSEKLSKAFIVVTAAIAQLFGEHAPLACQSANDSAVHQAASSAQNS